MNSKPGRPRKYADSKERFVVANKKKPSVRLNSKEKDLIDLIREKDLDLDEITAIISKNNKVATTKQKVATTKQKVATTILNSSQIDLSLSNENLVRELKKVGISVKFGTKRFQLKRKVNKYNSSLKSINFFQWCPAFYFSIFTLCPGNAEIKSLKYSFVIYPFFLISKSISNIFSVSFIIRASNSSSFIFIYPRKFNLFQV